MKLIIQIPCFNEQDSLPVTLAELPRSLPGIDLVEWLVIDDGSSDRTVEVARALGVDHIVRFERNRGLAAAFMAGLDASLKAGADIIVNTDADNQYSAASIPALIAPILRGEAQMVVGARPIGQIDHFSPVKKALQRLGSWVVRVTSGTDIADAPSGFRAIGREAALRLNVFNRYTYTLETIIQAGRRGITTQSVPIRVNGDLRPSRLVRSIRAYVTRNMWVILRIFSIYRPLSFFTMVGAVPFGIGFLIGLRWLALFLSGTDRTHIPSLILAAVLLLMGVMIWILGLVADLISVNREMLEDIRTRVRRQELAAARTGEPESGDEEPRPLSSRAA
ncbi:glycosyltransferase family 2 protein [Azospirillum brasilense]|uniref:Glycosyl transferase n=1 Tax=Azospirillum brasilense TaxID=192 RepID=A0A235HCE4_AZOBR|nr:glycosyltransferase family 2 protein [Azospirillum brasilense]OYD82905.1 glycosyl transferase [Azospirillum brasilense]